MKKNKKNTNKISELKQKLKNDVEEFYDIESDKANYDLFDLSSDNEKFLEQQNLELDKSLTAIEEDNSKLFSNVYALKQEVEKALASLDKDSHFLNLFKQFINFQQNNKLSDFDFSNEDIKKDNFDNLHNSNISSLKDEILQLLKIEDKTAKELDSKSDSNQNQLNLENYISLNLFNSLQDVFEKENAKIAVIKESLQDFVNDLSLDKFNSFENQNKISNKIKTLKNEFFRNINAVFENNDAVSTRKEAKIVKDSYKNTITSLYDELEKKLISFIESNSFNSAPTLIEQSKNYVDVSNIDVLFKEISELENKINLLKASHNTTDFFSELLKNFLFLNKIDESSIKKELDDRYFEICEKFIKNIELKNSIIKKSIDNFNVYIVDNCLNYVRKINDFYANFKINNANLNSIELSNNNFFIQKAIECFESLANKSKAIFDELAILSSKLLSDISLESFKNKQIDFSCFINLIQQNVKTFSKNIEMVITSFSNEVNKLTGLPISGIELIRNEIPAKVSEVLSFISKVPLELEEILADAKSANIDFYKFKFSKLEHVYNILQNYKIETIDSNLGYNQSNNYIDVRLERLERQYSKIFNLLDPIAASINKPNQELQNFKQNIDQKIDDLINKLASDRKDYETEHNDIIREILKQNEMGKENVINIIKSFEEKKLHLISEEAQKRVIENSSKLVELENLLALQNQEIESLLSEKNEFISEIEDILIHKKHKLTDEKIADLKGSINEVITTFNNRISDFEYNLDRKLSSIDLEAVLEDSQNTQQKELLNEIEQRLTANYGIVKEHVKQDFNQILDSVNNLNVAYAEFANKTPNYESRFNEINEQFSQFSFLLKNITEALQAKNSEQYEEVNELVKSLNTKFEGLIQGLKEENSKTSALFNKNANKASKRLKSIFNKSISEINEKFNTLLSEVKQENKSLEIKQSDVLDTVIASNQAQKEQIAFLINEISNINRDFLSEMEAKRINSENQKLIELERLINLQNDEIESLVHEKDDYIQEVKDFLINKKDELTNQGLIELKVNLNNVADDFNKKIEELEYAFDRKISEIDLNTIDQTILNNQSEFLKKVEDTLIINYDLVRNEFKQNIGQILSNINDLNLTLANSNFLKDFENRFNYIDQQFEQFRYLLKTVTDGLIDKNNKLSFEVNSIIDDLNSKFESLIKGIKEDNLASINSLTTFFSENNLSLKNEIQSDISSFSSRLNNLSDEFKNTANSIANDQLDKINYVIELNNKTRFEILNLIKNIEINNENFLTKLEEKKNIETNLKLKELDELIELQNNEIEALLAEKNEFIFDLENYLITKKDQLDNKKIAELERSVEAMISSLDYKIIQLEVNFNNRFNELDLKPIENAFASQSDLLNSIEEKLSNNYEIVKQELSHDINQVLSGVGELNTLYKSFPFEKYDSKFVDINNQFDQFRFLIKDVINSNLKNIDETKKVDELVDVINSKFDVLFKNLKWETIKSIKSLNNKIKNSESRISKQLDSSVDKVNAKFKLFVDEIKNQNKNFENSQLDTIYAIIEGNKANQYEILRCIKNLELSNANFLDEMQSQKLNYENSKLKELDQLIELQNSEIEALITEKNEFINDIQSFLFDKKNKIDNQNILDLKVTVDNAILGFNEKIDNLEKDFDAKLAKFDLKSLSDLISSEQAQFFDSVQNSLTYNYEIVKSEFQSNLSEIINSIVDINANNDAKFESLNEQLDGFRFILKDLVESFNRNSKESAIDLAAVTQNLENLFEKEIQKVKSEAFSNNKFIVSKINKINKKLSKNIDSNILNMNTKFDDLISHIQTQSDLVIQQSNILETLIEVNRQSQKELTDYITNLESTTLQIADEFKEIQMEKQSLKMKELESLIELQNTEVEALIQDKNDLISDIESFLREKNEMITNQNFVKLENTIKNIADCFDKKIGNLEVDLDTKLALFNADFLKQNTEFYKNNLVTDIEKQLSSNYEIVRNEFKVELSKILDSAETKFDKFASQQEEINRSGLLELNYQFDAFKDLVVRKLEMINDPSNSIQIKVDELLNNITIEFKRLVNTLASEYEVSNENLVNKVDELNHYLIENLNDNLLNVDKKFDNFIDTVNKKLQDFEVQQSDLITTLFNANELFRKDANDAIARIEKMIPQILDANLSNRYNLDIDNLKKLDELIDSQNQEINELINENNDYIDNVEKFLRNSQDAFENEKLNKIEKLISDINDKFDAKIKNFADEFNAKLNQFNLNDEDSLENESIFGVCKKLERNYSLLQQEFTSNFDAIFETLKNLDINENKNYIANELEQFKYEIIDKFEAHVDEINTKFAGLVKDVENTQVDAISLILDSNKINQKEISLFLDNLKNYGDDLVAKFGFNDKQKMVVLLQELKDLIELQSEEIKLFLSERERFIVETETYINKILTAKNFYANTQEIVNDFVAPVKNVLNEFINNFGKKLSTLRMDMTKRISLVVRDSKMVSKDFRDKVYLVQKNLADNYDFLNQDFNLFFEKISVMIADLENGSCNLTFYAKIDELQANFNKVKEIDYPLDKIFKDNALFNQIDDFVSAKFEANKNQLNPEILQKLDDLDNLELNTKIKNANTWYQDLSSYIENKNKTTTNYVSSKLEDLEKKSNKTPFSNQVNQKDLEKTYQQVLNKFLEISNYISLVKTNSLKLSSKLTANLVSDTQVNDIFKWFKKLLDSQNELIDKVLLQNQKYTNSINAIYNDNNLNENANDLEEILELLEKNTTSIKQELKSFELEISKLNSIIIEAKSSQEFSNDFLLDLNDAIRNNIDILGGLFINFKVKKDANLIKLQCIEDWLAQINNSVKSLTNSQFNQENFSKFNNEIDKIKSLLLFCHLDLILLKECEIEKTYANSCENSDASVLEFKKIVLLEDLIKYTKDYLKNIYLQKNKLISLLTQDKNIDNYLVELKVNQFYENLFTKLCTDQIKDLKEIVNKFNQINFKNNSKLEELLSANAIKNKKELYAKVAQLELKIGQLFDVIENKKKEFIDLISANWLDDDKAVNAIFTQFEKAEAKIKNEYELELNAFKNRIYDWKAAELDNYKQHVSDLETELNELKNNESLKSNKNDFEPLDNLVEELNLEIDSFEQERENQFKIAKSKLEYLNSLVSQNQEEIVNNVNVDKFKLNLNNEIKQFIEEEFNEFEKTFTKNLAQVKAGLNLMKASLEVEANDSDAEIDNPEWFKSFDDKLKNIEDEIFKNDNHSQKNVIQNSHNNIKLNVSNEKIKNFIVETEKRKKSSKGFTKKLKNW